MEKLEGVPSGVKPHGFRNRGTQEPRRELLLILQIESVEIQSSSSVGKSNNADV